MIKPEKILTMLNTPEDIEQLKELLRIEIRNEVALKTNDKTRVTQMNKMQKELRVDIETLKKHKMELGEDEAKKLIKLERAEGCGYYENNMFIFADNSKAFVLKDSLGFEPREDYPPAKILRPENTKLMSEEDLQNMLVCIKAKENYKYENTSFDYKHLDIFLKIIGESEMNYDPKMMRIFAKNNDNEIGVMYGIYQ